MAALHSDPAPDFIPLSFSPVHKDPTKGAEDFIAIDVPPVSETYSGRPTRTDRKNHMVPWKKRNYNTFKNPLMALHEEIIDFSLFVSPTNEENQARTQLIDTLESIIHHLWSNVEVVPFGSIATKLYLPASDIDLVVFGAPSNKLNRLALELKNRNMVSYLEVIDKARVPLVKFTDKSTGLMVDISFDTHGGPEAVKFIQDQLKLLPALRPLTLVLKYFLSCRKINEPFTGGLGSYALILMIISHLQLTPCLNGSQWRKTDETTNLGALLMSFFDTYGFVFNYVRVAISVRNGGRYYSKRDLKFYDDKRPAMLSIENPLDTSMDVCKSSYHILRIRKAFQYAYVRLAADTDLLSPTLLSRILPIDDPLLCDRAVQFNTNIPSSAPALQTQYSDSIFKSPALTSPGFPAYEPSPAFAAYSALAHSSLSHSSEQFSLLSSSQTVSSSSKPTIQSSDLPSTNSTSSPYNTLSSAVSTSSVSADIVYTHSSITSSSPSVFSTLLSTSDTSHQSSSSSVSSLRTSSTSNPTTLEKSATTKNSTAIKSSSAIQSSATLKKSPAVNKSNTIKKSTVVKSPTQVKHASGHTKTLARSSSTLSDQMTGSVSFVDLTQDDQAISPASADTSKQDLRRQRKKAKRAARRQEEMEEHGSPASADTSKQDLWRQRKKAKRAARRQEEMKEMEEHGEKKPKGKKKKKREKKEKKDSIRFVDLRHNVADVESSPSPLPSQAFFKPI